MELLWKLLSQYFLKLGTVLGIFQFTFNQESFVAKPSQGLKVYSRCLHTTLGILYIVSTISILVHLRDDNDLSVLKMMGMVYLFELVTQNISFILIVHSLVYVNTSKLIELINCGGELWRLSKQCFSMQFFWMIIGWSVIQNWISCTIDFVASFSTVSYNFEMSWTIIIYSICGFINTLVGNLFFCAMLCTASFYKSLNKDLKLIIKPLKSDKLPSHSQTITTSDRIDQTMILHAKIGRFVQDLNKIFSSVCGGMLVYSFGTIVGESYSLYSITRVETEDIVEDYKNLSMYMVALQILLVLSFVYASSIVTGQIERTAEILKVFLDPSVDDRLKNSVIDDFTN